MKAGGIFGSGTMGGLGDYRPGVFGLRVHGVSGLGQTTTCSSLPAPTSGGTAAMVAWMTQNCINCGGSAADCAAQSAKFAQTAVNCGPKCAGFKQDTPEWAQCIQKCHGYPPVSYDGEKAACEKQGKIYSWLENACIDKAKYLSCPTGTMYAKYPDGSEKCIAETHDLTKTTCPAGTTLKTVPGGTTCVSPVVPPKTPTTKTPAPTTKTPGTVTGAPPPETKLSLASMFSNPYALAGIALVVVGGIALATSGGKKKGKKGKEGGSK